MLQRDPLTAESLVAQLRASGLAPGDTVIVHMSLRSLGWVVGGAQSVVQALLDAVERDGTLVMPSHTSGNSDPSHWRNPPVPKAWWPTIRAAMPPFDKARSPTRGMGVVAELFRTWPSVARSDHPTASFAAFGSHAEAIVENHPLSDMFGDGSPLGRLYDLDGKILLLGVGYESNTSLHLAESRLGQASLPWSENGAAVMVDGAREWVRYRRPDWNASDFAELGAAYESEFGMEPGRIGRADARVLDMRPLVDWAVEWLRHKRGGVAPEEESSGV